MKKRICAVSVIFLLALCLCTFVSCTDIYAAGLNEDTRTFKKVNDARMYGEAPDYAGYVWKSDQGLMYFRLKEPADYDENKAYPLVVFLHGSGDWGTNNTRHMYRSLIDGVARYAPEECFVLMPQSQKGKDWSADGCDAIYNEVLNAVPDKWSIDEDRIYLTGMSMGGFGAIYQAATHPTLYAAVMPLCSGMSSPADAVALKDKPVWIGHSKDDPTVDFALSQQLYDELLRLGNTDAHFSVFEHEGHQVTQAFYSQPQVWSWLFAKTLAAAQPTI